MTTQRELKKMDDSQYINFWLETHGDRTWSELMKDKKGFYVVMTDGQRNEVKTYIEKREHFLIPMSDRKGGLSTNLSTKLSTAQKSEK